MIQDMQLNFFVENAVKGGGCQPRSRRGLGEQPADSASVICRQLIGYMRRSACRTDHGTVAGISGDFANIVDASMLAKIIPSGMPDGILVGSMVSLRPYLVGFRFKCNRSTFQRESL